MSRQPDQVLGLIRAIFHQGAMGTWTDGQLLERFAAGGEGKEGALEVLIERHGPMVLGICRRTLNDPHDVEDAFQSTFLVLVRKANQLRNRDLVGNWLYGVACRVAAKSRAEGRRRAHAPVTDEPAAPEAGTESDRGERLAALDEEIGRLPEKYRVPLVLCYLQGVRHQEVAHRLGCPVGTVESRLSRARDRLRDRLTRRGMAPALALLLAPSRSATAAVPPSLVGATLRAAAGHASGLALAVGASSTLVASRSLLLGFVALGVATAVLGGMMFNAGPSPRDANRRPASTPDQRVDPGIPAKKAPQVVRSPVATSDPPVMPPRPTRPTPPPTPGRDPSAVAVPLRGITIDGDLKDWPVAMQRYPVRKMLVGGPLGDGGLKGADLSTSPDLSVAFSVGYDLKEQLIYLAVVVRDDKLIVGNTSHLDTDAVEVYVDGLRGERRIPRPEGMAWWEKIDLSDLPVQQYVAIPGPGKVYGTKYATNPVLLAGDLEMTRTRMAFRREGDVTTYEWAIQPFDRYPDQPTRLEPGKRIGFDLAIADKDVPATSPEALNEPEEDRVAWIYWGPRWAGLKAINAGNLGELILGTEP